MSKNPFAGKGINFADPKRYNKLVTAKDGSQSMIVGRTADQQQLHLHLHKGGGGQTFSLYQNGKPESRVTDYYGTKK